MCNHPWNGICGYYNDYQWWCQFLHQWFLVSLNTQYPEGIPGPE